MTNEKKIELLADLFELDESELDTSMELAAMDTWESMTMLSLIVLMDDECGKRLTSDDIKTFVTVQDVMNYME